MNREIKNSSYHKKIASAELCLAKSAVHRLCAEVPCNYILGRLAAALQSIFASPNSARAIFLQAIRYIDFPVNAYVPCSGV